MKARGPQAAASGDRGLVRRVADWIFRRPVVEWVSIANAEEYAAYQQSAAAMNQEARIAAMLRASGGEPFDVPGYCHVCAARRTFQVDYRYSYEVDGVRAPNWREQLRCPGCQLNARMRAAMLYLEDVIAPPDDALIYAMEQTTALYRALSTRYVRLIGSEYLGDGTARGGHDARGIRNETITALTFESHSLDLVISLEVLEHVPDFERGLAECCRVLRPGGTLLFSVPFRADLSQNVVRATVDETGRVRHLMDPEYHGDPLQAAGCLAYHIFGWELLDRTRSAGFKSVCGYTTSSTSLGFADRSLMFFVAHT
jgi:hypothetical protein